MSTHNICFYGEIRKIILELSPNIPEQLLCSLLQNTRINTSQVMEKCVFGAYTNIKDPDQPVKWHNSIRASAIH